MTMHVKWQDAIPIPKPPIPATVCPIPVPKPAQLMLLLQLARQGVSSNEASKHKQIFKFVNTQQTSHGYESKTRKPTQSQTTWQTT